LVQIEEVSLKATPTSLPLQSRVIPEDHGSRLIPVEINNIARHTPFASRCLAIRGEAFYRMEDLLIGSVRMAGRI
jgi:hypothetical protein